VSCAFWVLARLRQPRIAAALEASPS